MTDADKVLELILAANRPSDEVIRGADDADLEMLSKRLDRDLPDSLVAFLRLANGPLVGPGGFFGQRPDRSFTDLPSRLALFPEWRALNWIPVAGDGCGNYYVLLETGEVGFVDTIRDTHTLCVDEDYPIYPDLLACVEALLLEESEVDA